MHKSNVRKLLASVATLSMALGYASPVLAVENPDPVPVTFYGTVTDAGQVIDKMVIDYGGDQTVAGVTNDTYTVHLKSTVATGVNNGKEYFNDNLTVVDTVTEGDTVTVYFDLSAGSTLTWLSDPGESRNYPANLELTVTQNDNIQVGDDSEYKATNYTNAVKTYADLVDPEVEKFTSVTADINYQIHKGSNDALIVWFHGNGEGDLPTGQTNNNIAQVLANRGAVAWTTPEAQAVFGDATVMAFQAPNAWYYATANDHELLKLAKAEIDDVIALYHIDPEKVYVSGCSAGGFMTTRMLIDYPNFFKAAMINCPALNVASDRSGLPDATPTDEEIASLRNSDTAIWLVQGTTDSSVATAECSQRMWNILSEGEEISTSQHEGTDGIASGFTTYETADDKFKLSLYETTEDAKLNFAEDYDRDGTNTLVQYSNHWSWIYTLRNNPVDADDTHIWNWAVNYAEPVYEALAGTQRLVIDGDDWGPAVTKTILSFDEAVDAASVSADTFAVTETKESTDFTAEGFPHTIVSSPRTVTNAYLSDAEGNKVDSESAKYVTIEMAVDPNTGSPFIYDMNTGRNSWCDPYQLEITGNVTVGGETRTLAVEKTIDVTDSSTRISLVADEFNLSTYKAASGTTYSYGEYVPEKDEKKNALVIWLHGAGEGGSDNYIDLLGNEVTALAKDGFQSAFDGAYILTPQSPTMWMDGGNGQYQSEGNSIYAEDLFELIDAYVKGNDDIDPDRIIIGGCSNGGYMTMEMVLKHPDYFYKAYPICEAYTDSAITDEQIAAVKEGGTGFWFTYALNDTTVNPTTTAIPTIERFKVAGIEVHVSEWADVHDTTGRFTNEDGTPYQYNGHWSWTYFFNNENTCKDCAASEWQWLALEEGETLKPEQIKTEGESSEYVLGSDKDLSFKFSGKAENLMGVLVDGKLLSEGKDYYVSSDLPTIINLKAEYLETLKAGKHTLTAAFNNGEANAEFTITNPADKGKSPDTGVRTSYAGYAGAALVSGAAIIAILLKKRKH